MLSQAEILAQLRRDRATTIEEGWTRAEYCELTGLGRTAAKDRISRGLDNGTIVRGPDRSVLSRAGVLTPVPSYRFTDAYKAEATANAKSHRAQVGPAPGVRVVPRQRAS